MESIISISKDEAIRTLVFLEWLKSYVMLWKLKETPVPWPKGCHEYHLDEIILKFKEATR